MKITGDYHTHTYYSDGRSGIGHNFEFAKERKLCEFAVTDHSFASFIFHMTRKKYERQQKKIDALNASGQGVKVLHGVEANIINFDGDTDVPKGVIARLDIMHLGFHRFLGLKYVLRALKFVCINGYSSRSAREKIREENTEAYIRAMKKYPVDTVAHLNHRALVDTKRICETAAQEGIYIELNQKHLDTLKDDVATVIASGVNLIVGTDAHTAKDVGKLDKVCKFIEENDIPRDRVFGIDGNIPKFKDKRNYR